MTDVPVHHATPAADVPDVSVVISTYNRADLIVDAVRSVLAQRADTPPFELIVVDNNSKDDTRRTVQALAETDARVRYLFEPRQGVCHGRNAGIAAARAPIVAFTDDDVRARPDWIAAIAHGFQAAPWAQFIGGRVLPRWPGGVPAWLTPEHWSPLALLDYGPSSRRIELHDPLCLVACNAAFRRSILTRVGGFDPRFQHRPGARAACEDWELELRILRAGGSGLYVPEMVTDAEVQPERLTMAYHRRWHFDHGRAIADLLEPGERLDRSGLPTPRPVGSATLLGVEPWAYRAVLTDSWSAVRARVGGRTEDAFAAECRVLEVLGQLAGVRERERRMPAQRLAPALTIESG